VTSLELLIYGDVKINLLFNFWQDVRAQMTMPLPGFEVSDVDSHDHRYVFRLEQARKNMYFACDDKLTIEKWKYAIGQASKGYDLSREDVQRLGRPVSACSSEENHEEQEEAKDQLETEVKTSMELRLDKYIDDDDTSDEPSHEQEDASISEENTEINSESNESISSNDMES